MSKPTVEEMIAGQATKEQAIEVLRDAIYQLLDDMGSSGKSVCLAAKQDAIEAIMLTDHFEKDPSQTYLNLPTTKRER